MKKYNLSSIMKKAWELVKEYGITISAGLKISWKEAKELSNQVKDAVVMHFGNYNENRDGRPWVCKIVDGKYNFKEYVGEYTAEDGYEGNLVVFEPVVDQVYGFGRKDHKGGNTMKEIVKWNGFEFVKCNKYGFEYC